MNDPERLFPATASPTEGGSGKRSQTQARTASGKRWETVGNAPGVLRPTASHPVPDVVDDQGAATDLKRGASDLSTAEPIDWDARLRAAVAETVAKRQARQAERRKLDARRQVGLQQRHAAKLARNQTRPTEGETP
jgi:hypothetical protein